MIRFWVLITHKKKLYPEFMTKIYTCTQIPSSDVCIILNYQKILWDDALACDGQIYMIWTLTISESWIVVGEVRSQSRRTWLFIIVTLLEDGKRTQKVALVIEWWAETLKIIFTDTEFFFKVCYLLIKLYSIYLRGKCY